LNYISQSFIGAQIFRFDQLESTNDTLRDLAEKKTAQHGAIVTAKFQTKGRGQIANIWESDDDKNLLLSLYVTPQKILATEQVYLNLFACLAVFDFVNKEFPERTKIKWPNDIYVDDKKVAGILIENNIQGDSVKSSIIGLGININQSNFLVPNALSFYQISAHEYNLVELLYKLVECFNFRLEELSLQLQNKLMGDYLNVMYRKGFKANYRANGLLFEGEIIGIDNVGRLKLLVDGEIKLFSFKEISYE
jgi:BirA family transcriptional regulator, biotin operon repressor / biotin---[acetyl-CoA-carboxylase] ligase